MTKRDQTEAALALWRRDYAPRVPDHVDSHVRNVAARLSGRVARQRPFGCYDADLEYTFWTGVWRELERHIKHCTGCQRRLVENWGWVPREVPRQEPIEREDHDGNTTREEGHGASADGHDANSALRTTSAS